MRSSVTTSPREANSGTPPRVAEDFFGFVGGPARPRRAKVEITCPAVPPSRCASSLAACSTSSSMSKVVLIHLMLLHHRIKVKIILADSALKCEVAELILFVRRLREFQKMKNKTSGNLPLTNVSFLIHFIADESRATAQRRFLPDRRGQRAGAAMAQKSARRRAQEHWRGYFVRAIRVAGRQAARGQFGRRHLGNPLAAAEPHRADAVRRDG